MNSEIPEIKEWLKNNRNKTINDYYSLYPHQAKQSIKTEINSSLGNGINHEHCCF